MDFTQPELTFLRAILKELTFKMDGYNNMVVAKSIYDKLTNETKEGETSS